MFFLFLHSASVKNRINESSPRQLGRNVPTTTTVSVEPAIQNFAMLFPFSFHHGPFSVDLAGWLIGCINAKLNGFLSVWMRNFVTVRGLFNPQKSSNSKSLSLVRFDLACFRYDGFIYHQFISLWILFEAVEINGFFLSKFVGDLLKKLCNKNYET